MAKTKTINLNGIEVRTMDTPFGKYLCITDLAKAIGDPTGLAIGNWFRLIGTTEYLKEWELEYNNKNFNISRYADIIRAESHLFNLLLGLLYQALGSLVFRQNLPLMLGNLTK